MAALPVTRALQEFCQYSRACDIAGDHIHDGRLDLAWFGIRNADDAHQSGIGLQDAVHASTVGIRPLLAIG